MAAKISNWLGTRSHRSHLSAALVRGLHTQHLTLDGVRESGSQQVPQVEFDDGMIAVCHITFCQVGGLTTHHLKLAGAGKSVSQPVPQVESDDGMIAACHLTVWRVRAYTLNTLHWMESGNQGVSQCLRWSMMMG